MHPPGGHAGARPQLPIESPWSGGERCKCVRCYRVMRGSVGRTRPLRPGSWREGLVRASYDRTRGLSLEVRVGRGVWTEDIEEFGLGRVGTEMYSSADKSERGCRG